MHSQHQRGGISYFRKVKIDFWGVGDVKNTTLFIYKAQIYIQYINKHYNFIKGGTIKKTMSKKTA